MKTATNEITESSWSIPSTYRTHVSLLLAKNPFGSAIMSTFAKLTFMVLVRLSLRTAVWKRIQALSRDVLWPAAAQTDEMRMRRSSFDIFEMPGLKFFKDSKVGRAYTSETSTILWKLLCSSNDDHRNSDRLRKYCSTFMLNFKVVQAIEYRWLFASCVVFSRTWFLDNFISRKTEYQSHRRFCTAYIAVRHLIKCERTANHCLTADIPFPSGISQQYKIRFCDQDCVWPVPWKAGKVFSHRHTAVQADLILCHVSRSFSILVDFLLQWCPSFFCKNVVSACESLVSGIVVEPWLFINFNSFFKSHW